MPKFELPQVGGIHLVGIAGAGMSGLAHILLKMGHLISGSDLNDNLITQRLKKQGAVIYLGHRRENLDRRVSLVVVSSAVAADNPEVLEARERGVTVISRGEMLARVVEPLKGIAVSGAHGKTTTTAMIALALERNGFDPTILVGGELRELQGNAKLGKSEYIVTEADESDGSFLKLSPFCTVVTNIENDHLDYYRTFDNIAAAFKQFLGNTRQEGFSVVCWDDHTLRQFSREVDRRFITYGLSPEADFWLDEVEMRGLFASARVRLGEKPLGRLRLSVPGRHNLLNALAAVAVGRELGITFTEVTEALEPFRGVHRRFEILGEVNQVMVVDDYAHHPTEIRATLQAARQLPGRRIIAVFQPHRYTRTSFLFDQFGAAFGDADRIVVNEIYSAGEKPVPGVSAQLIVEAIERRGQKVNYIPQMDEILEFLVSEVRPGDLVLTLGAGNIWTVGEALVRRLQK
ncbi:MAG: UDP-N-acetylmuramate--L-alanine ligase [Syntrophomonadaceae bacterium]|nr:UDP-N-acetylmuramate--L-alanine ligase [Syntrophomonadaceae bacterium]